jgi:hypothetical protein
LSATLDGRQADAIWAIGRLLTGPCAENDAAGQAARSSTVLPGSLPRVIHKLAKVTHLEFLLCACFAPALIKLLSVSPRDGAPITAPADAHNTKYAFFMMALVK